MPAWSILFITRSIFSHQKLTLSAFLAKIQTPKLRNCIQMLIDASKNEYSVICGCCSCVLRNASKSEKKLPCYKWWVFRKKDLVPLRSEQVICPNIIENQILGVSAAYHQNISPFFKRQGFYIQNGHRMRKSALRPFPKGIHWLPLKPFHFFMKPCI